MNRRGEATGVVLVMAAVILGVLLLGGACWGYPQYNVYRRQKSGEAQLAEAQSNRTIAVLEARALKESAVERAQADSIRALGVASANRIIGHSLKDNPEYLTWLWVEALKDGQHDVIYVPTEGQLPMLEAGRLGNIAKRPSE
jgi:regulator of protease activity HflC (stomatin/prohibitin superfamily)